MLLGAAQVLLKGAAMGSHALGAVGEGDKKYVKEGKMGKQPHGTCVLGLCVSADG